MECIHLWLALLYFPGLFAQSNSNDFTDVGNYSKMKRISLRSNDPLTRRSPAEKNFLRLGRNGNSPRYHDYFRARISGNFHPTHHTPKQKKDLHKREIFQFTNETNIPSQHFTVRTIITKPSRIPVMINRSYALPKEESLVTNGHSTFSRSRDNNDFYLYLASGKNAGAAKNLVDENDDDATAAAAAAAAGDNDYRPNTNNYHRSNNGSWFLHDKDSKAWKSIFNFKKNRGNKLNKNQDAAASSSSFIRIESLNKNRHENSNAFKSLHGDGYLRRALRSKFSKNLFSRYDRGRDNFMRLGRSDSNFEETGHVRNIETAENEESTNIGDCVNDNSAICNTKIGFGDGNVNGGESGDGSRQNADKGDKHYRRFSRKQENFMRLGRESTAANSPRLLHYDELVKENNYPPPIDHRIGKPFSKKKDNNFMRLGRGEKLSGGSNVLDDDVGRSMNGLEMSKRMKADNFMRLGRTMIFQNEEKPSTTAGHNAIKHADDIITLSIPAADLQKLSHFPNLKPTNVHNFEHSPKPAYFSLPVINDVDEYNGKYEESRPTPNNSIWYRLLAICPYPIACKKSPSGSNSNFLNKINNLDWTNDGISLKGKRRNNLILRFGKRYHETLFPKQNTKNTFSQNNWRLLNSKSTNRICKIKNFRSNSTNANKFHYANNLDTSLILNESPCYTTNTINSAYSCGRCNHDDADVNFDADNNNDDDEDEHEDDNNDDGDDEDDDDVGGDSNSGDSGGGIPSNRNNKNNNNNNSNYNIFYRNNNNNNNNGDDNNKRNCFFPCVINTNNSNFNDQPREQNLSYQ